MLLGVISDTHGHRESTLAATRMLDSLEVEQVLHCGDIGSLEIVPLLAAWPTHFVFGNVDDQQDELRASIETAGQTCHGRYGELEISGRQIAILHSDDHLRWREAIDSQQFDLVCYGHTHQAEQHMQGRTLVLNPGAIHRASPHTIAVVDLVTMQATIVPYE
jgi:hypothetical protein